MTKPLHADGPWHDDGVNDPPVASFLNDARTWMPDMVDGAGGGTWSPTAAITIGGSGLSIGSASPAIANTGMLATLAFAVGAFLQAPRAIIADADNQTLDPANGIVQWFADPAVQREHDLVAAGNAGRFFILIQNEASVNNILIRRSGFAGDTIVTLADAWDACLLYDDGTNWRLLIKTFGATEGAHA